MKRIHLNKSKHSRFPHYWGLGGCLLVASAVQPFCVAAHAQTTQTPPPPAAPRPLTVPRASERTLPNGLRVIVLPRAGSGLLSAVLLVRSGGAFDPQDKAGLANVTADLLNKGAGGKTAPQIAEAVEALGANLSAGAGWDSSTVSLSAPASQFGRAFPLMADVALRPRFDRDEWERLRAQDLDDLSVSLGAPGTLARYAASRVVFGDAPYGHPLGGTPQSLARITEADAATFHRAFYRPDNAVLIVVGDTREADAFALAEAQFGGWQKPSAPLPAPPAGVAVAESSSGRRIVVVDKPDAGQAAVLVARTGIARTDSAFDVATVANTVLGSGFSSRLNQEVRIKRGLSYGAGSGLQARARIGPFTASAQTKNESAGEVAELLASEVARLGTGELTDTELTPRKAVVVGDFARDLETGSGLAGQIADLVLYNIPLDTLNGYVGRVSGVTGEQVRGFARTRLAPGAANVVIAGDAKKFLPDLQKRFPGATIEVIPAADIDFNSATLKK